jgi:pyrophosphatase PpaX
VLSAFVFDLDGTLIDSLLLIRRSYEHALGRPVERDEFVAGLGRPLAWQFGRYTSDPQQIDSFIATYRAYNREHHDTLVRPFPGVAEALAELRARGGRIAVVTSKLRSSARHGLDLCGLTELVDVVLGVDDVARAKPDPDPVLRALGALGQPSQTAVVVGDSPHDIAAGRAAGTLTAAVLWGPLTRAELLPCRPDRWLEEPAAIASLDDP